MKTNVHDLLKSIIVACVCLTANYTANAQIGINTTSPDSSSVLDITSDQRGLLIPRLTTDKRKSLTDKASNGLLVYDIDLSMFMFFNKATLRWEALNPWQYGNIKKGNDDVNTDVIIVPTTNVGIGTDKPGAKLHVVGTTKFEGNSTITNDLTVGNGASNLTVNGSTTINGNLNVNGTISGNGSGVSNVNATQLDSHPGSYYATQTDKNELNTKIDNNANSVTLLYNQQPNTTLTVNTSYSDFSVSNGVIYSRKIGMIYYFIGRITITSINTISFKKSYDIPLQSALTVPTMEGALIRLNGGLFGGDNVYLPMTYIISDKKITFQITHDKQISGNETWTLFFDNAIYLFN
jgi:hypothetical protein